MDRREFTASLVVVGDLCITLQLYSSDSLRMKVVIFTLSITNAVPLSFILGDRNVICVVDNLSQGVVIVGNLVMWSVRKRVRSLSCHMNVN